MSQHSYIAGRIEKTNHNRNFQDCTVTSKMCTKFNNLSDVNNKNFIEIPMTVI